MFHKHVSLLFLYRNIMTNLLNEKTQCIICHLKIEALSHTSEIPLIILENSSYSYIAGRLLTKDN